MREKAVEFLFLYKSRAQTLLYEVVAPCYEGVDNKIPQLQATKCELIFNSVNKQNIHGLWSADGRGLMKWVRWFQIFTLLFNQWDRSRKRADNNLNITRKPSLSKAMSLLYYESSTNCLNLLTIFFYKTLLFIFRLLNTEENIINLKISGFCL